MPAVKKKKTFKYKTRVATDFSERLKYSSQHLLSDVEVQRSHVESHRTRAALLEVVGSRCSSVLLGLRRAKHRGRQGLIEKRDIVYEYGNHDVRRRCVIKLTCHYLGGLDNDGHS